MNETRAVSRDLSPGRSRLDRYLDEAQQAPFDLVLDDGYTITVLRPGVETILAAAQAPSALAALRIMAGEQYPALTRALGAEDSAVLTEVARDMATHFGVPEASHAAALVGRYGDAIRADLRSRYQVDMLDFLRGTLTAEALLDYLRHLPRTSAYHQALAQDEELAEKLANDPDSKPGPPPLTEFGPDVQVLAELRDLVASLIAVTIKAHGGKPSKVKPYPRPDTAIQRARRRARFRQHQSVVARVLPGR